MASDDEKMPDVDEVNEDTENHPQPNCEEESQEKVEDEEVGTEKPAEEPEDKDGDAEAEADAPEPEHRFDDDDDEDEDLAEDIPKAPPAPAPLQPKDTGGTQSHSQSQSQSQSQTVSVQRGTQRFTARYDRIVSAQGAAVEEARNWLTRVLVDGPRAVADILAVVVSPAVGKGAEFMDDDLITQRTVMRNEPVESVKEVCTELEGESKRVAGLLVTAKRARVAFQEFWSRVASDSSGAVLYDTDCFDTLLSWLEAMSTAKLSILRHSACVAAYSIVDGLIETGARLRSKLATRQRQLQTEKLKCEKKAKKGTPVKFSKHYKKLSEDIDIMAANNGELIELADKVFTGIFVLKYRDVAPEIRVVSMEFLGKWIMKYPDHYLDDTHTKYVGWLLSDKDPGVRRACLMVLNDMLREPDFFQSLELFLRRFLSRIVEMCRDKDTDVAVRAIRICALLVPYDILDHEACDKLSDQMFEDPIVAVRKAAGEFVAALIADPQGDSTAPSTKRKRGKKKSDALTSDIPPTQKAMGLLQELMNVCIKEDGQQMDSAAVIIESIWDFMPAFRAWQAYANLLEQDDDADDDALPESHKALLCELLVHAAKIVVDSEPKPQALAKSNRKNAAAAKELCSDALARIFTPLIPKLLVQYQGSSRILAALVQIPTYFSDLHFQEAAQKQHFLQLLHRLVGAISKHTGSSEVLNAASATFKTMFAEMHPLNALAKESLAKAATETAKELRMLVASGIEGSDAVKVEASVLKAKVISELMELPEGVPDDVLAILDAVFEKELPVRFNTTIAINALFVATGTFAWDALKASQLLGIVTGQDREAELEEAETKLKNTFDEVVRRLIRLSEYPFALRVRERAAVAISSILFLRRNIMRSLNLNLDENSGEEGNNTISLSDKAIVAVSNCLIDIIHAQWGLPLRHPKVVPRYENKRGKDAEVTESDVHSLVLSLIQLTMKTAVPDRFLHLPFLGLLLNRRRGEVDIMDLCKRFLKLKIEDKHGAPHEFARDALFVASNIVGGPRETKHFAVSQLARAFVEGTPDKTKSELFFANLIQALVDKCRISMGNEGEMRDAISVMGKANAFFATRVNTETAAPILTDMRKLRTDLRENENLEKNVREELSMLVSPIIQQLDLFSSGEETFRTPRTRKRFPRPVTRGGRRKKTRRRSDAIPWQGASHVNVESSQGLRRSGRTRKPRTLELYDTEVRDDNDEDLMEEDDPVQNMVDDDSEDDVEQDEEAEKQEDEVEDAPVTPSSKKKRRSKAKDDEDEEIDEEEPQESEDEVDDPPVTPSKKKKRRSKAKHSEDEDMIKEPPVTPSKKKKPRSKAKDSEDEEMDEDVSRESEDEAEEEPVAIPSKKKKRRSRAKQNESEEMDEEEPQESEERPVTPAKNRKRRSKAKHDEQEDEKEDVLVEQERSTSSSQKRKRSNSSKLASGLEDEEESSDVKSKRRRSSIPDKAIEQRPEGENDDEEEVVENPDEEGSEDEEESENDEEKQSKANRSKKSSDEAVSGDENSEEEVNENEGDNGESEEVKTSSDRKRRASKDAVEEDPRGRIRRTKKIRTW